MKPYLTLLLAYLDVYHTVDYVLLDNEFHVSSRQITEWLEMLSQEGYIRWENDGFYLTPMGQPYKAASWLEFSDHTSQTKSNRNEKFSWDFLYIPKNFET